LRETISFRYFDDFFRQKQNDYLELIKKIHFYSGGLGGIVAIAEYLQKLKEDDLFNHFSSRNQ